MSAEKMMEIFSGNENAHGTHGQTSSSDRSDGKIEIKKTARTIKEPVTVEHWRKHLSGERPLGVIPIRNDGTCLWACIDVDRYDLDHAEIARELLKNEMPLVLCRSKSGGAHVFVFFREPQKCDEVRAVLQQIAARYGWGECEIFPKQTEILSSRGDFGNWLNMPYLGGDETKRYAVRDNGTSMSLFQFLRHVESIRTTADGLLGALPAERSLPSKDSSDGDLLGGGPPCLQHLASVGVGEGSRHNALMNFGVFCKKKYPERWEDVLETINREVLDPPADSSSMAEIIKYLREKDYFYRCREQPIVSHCNSGLCRMRRFGVGGSRLYPKITGISKLDSDPPIWFLDIDEKRIALTTAQLQNYREFQKACMEQLTVFFQPMKTETWAEMIGGAMADAIVIEVPHEATNRGYFEELLESFCTSRYVGDQQEDVRLGKPWKDSETGRVYFKLSALMEHLERNNFREWGRNKVSHVVSSELGGKAFFNFGGRGVRVLYIDAEHLSKSGPPIPLPKKKRVPI